MQILLVATISAVLVLSNACAADAAEQATTTWLGVPDTVRDELQIQSQYGPQADVFRNARFGAVGVFHGAGRWWYRPEANSPAVVETQAPRVPMAQPKATILAQPTGSLFQCSEADRQPALEEWWAAMGPRLLGKQDANFRVHVTMVEGPTTAVLATRTVNVVSVVPREQHYSTQVDAVHRTVTAAAPKTATESKKPLLNWRNIVPLSF